MSLHTHLEGRWLSHCNAGCCCLLEVGAAWQSGDGRNRRTKDSLSFET